MDFLDVTKALAPVVGAGAGLAVGGPAGAVAGYSAGSALSAGLGLFEETPKVPGVSGAQKSALSAQQQLLEQQMGLQGMSTAEVARQQQLMQGTMEQQIQMANVLRTTQLSPLERERLAKALDAKARKAQIDFADRLQSYDERAQARRVMTSARLAGDVGRTGQAIREQELQKKLIEEKFERERNANFQRMIQSATQAAVTAAGMFETAPTGEIPEYDIMATEQIPDYQFQVDSYPYQEITAPDSLMTGLQPLKGFDYVSAF